MSGVLNCLGAEECKNEQPIDFSDNSRDTQAHRKQVSKALSEFGARDSGFLLDANADKTLFPEPKKKTSFAH